MTAQTKLRHTTNQPLFVSTPFRSSRTNSVPRPAVVEVAEAEAPIRQSISHSRITAWAAAFRWWVFTIRHRWHATALIITQMWHHREINLSRQMLEPHTTMTALNARRQPSRVCINQSIRRTTKFSNKMLSFFANICVEIFFSRFVFLDSINEYYLVKSFTLLYITSRRPDFLKQKEDGLYRESFSKLILLVVFNL